MRIRVGTSGFSYAEWKGTFYPEKHPPKKMLSYYAERFSAVEINATFYRMPKETMLLGWLAEVPEDFTFVLKAPVHIRYQEPVAGTYDATEPFCEIAKCLGARLGPLLFQLPPHFKKDIPRLDAYLARLPRIAPVVIEFTDASWFCDEAYALLQRRGAAMCIVDDVSEKRAAPLVRTAPHGYLRLRKVDYSDADVAGWAAKIRGAGWDMAHVFFKHEDAGTGPALARRLLDSLGQKR